MMPRAAAFASEVVPNDSFVPISEINYFLENKFPCVQKTNAYICQPLCQANPLLRLSFPLLCLLTARSTSPELSRPLSTSLDLSLSSTIQITNLPTPRFEPCTFVLQDCRSTIVPSGLLKHKGKFLQSDSTRVRKQSKPLFSLFIVLILLNIRLTKRKMS